MQQNRQSACQRAYACKVGAAENLRAASCCPCSSLAHPCTLVCTKHAACTCTCRPHPSPITLPCHSSSGQSSRLKPARNMFPKPGPGDQGKARPERVAPFTKTQKRLECNKPRRRPPRAFARLKHRHIPCLRPSRKTYGCSRDYDARAQLCGVHACVCARGDPLAAAVTCADKTGSWGTKPAGSEATRPAACERSGYFGRRLRLARASTLAHATQEHQEAKRAAAQPLVGDGPDK